MLVELTVEHIGLMERVEWVIGSRLSVITGETGAGKSVLLDSIGFLLGERFSPEMIQTGYDEGLVEGTFHLPVVPVLLSSKLTEWGIEVEADLILHRRVSRNGRSICKLNGRSVNVRMLREIGSLLVQQHSQHEQHGLLQPSVQMLLLDSYGHLEDLVNRVRNCYTEWQEADELVTSLHTSSRERLMKMDMLAFQRDEIDQAALSVGEDDALRLERKRLQAADKIRHAFDEAMVGLDGGTDSGGIVAELAHAETTLSSVCEFHPELNEVVALLNTARVHAEEAEVTLQKFGRTLEFQPERFQEVEDRLAVIRSLLRKYGSTIEEVLAYRERIVAELDVFSNLEDRMEEAQRRASERKQALLEAAAHLTEERKKIAHKLSAETVRVLKQLDMDHADFQVHFVPREISPMGAEQIEYIFTSNVGEELRPLAKTASGGELSRTLLALKVVLAEVDEVDTLIFDEIDTGVSGVAAQRIAEQLRILSEHRQVLCVTHSAQIAASGHDHYIVRKEVLENSMRSTVQYLHETERIDEVARLLGSSVADSTALEHARALLKSYCQL